MRVFAALPLSPAAVERLLSLRLRLSAPRDGLRWSEPEQWHVTLQFYGEVTAAEVACLEAAMRGMAAVTPEIVLEGLGLFAGKGILYASVAATDSLVSLQREVLERGRACGFVPEDRPFRPHITLARSKGKTGLATLQKMSKPALPAFGTPIASWAGELLLLESELRPQGAAYERLAAIRLGGDGGDCGEGA